MKKQLRIKLTKSLLTMIAIVSLLPIVQPVFALPEPTVSTDAATNITTTTATLNGSVSDAGDSPVTSRGFNYGTTDSYGDNANEVVPESFEYVSQWGSEVTSDGKLKAPDSVVVDPSGNIYVSDSNNQRIQKFNSSGVYLSQIGSTMSGSGDGQFSTPLGIATDSSGNLYVADTYNHRIQKFNSNGVYLSQFGSSGLGDGQFNAPRGIAVDSTNNIYIVDSNNSRIQKFNSNGVFQSQIGSPGSGDGQHNTPYGIAVDSSDNVYVADTFNNRIQKFNSNGVYQSQFGSLGTGDGQFNRPQGISIDSDGSIFIADTDNNRIQKFNSSSEFQSKLGTSCSGNSQFNIIEDIAISPSGDVYTSDSEEHCIQKFNSNGVFQSQFGVYGTLNGQFSYPGKIAIDPSGNIYVADSVNARIQKFNSNGVYQSQFGSFGSGNGQFNAPIGIAVDSLDNIYIADTNNSRIQKFNSNGVYQSQFGSFGTDSGQFSSPFDIALDSVDNLYVVDTYNNRVQKFNNNGVYQSTLGTTGTDEGMFRVPRAIAIDSSDTIYVGDTLNHRIQTFTQGMNEGAFSTNLTNLSCGTTYHYQAYANNSDGSTEASDATFTTDACEPGSPTNLSAVSNASTSIEISWAAPTTTGSSSLSNYKVYYRVSGDIGWQEIDTQSLATAQTITGLIPNTQYNVKITAQNEDGYWSADSATENVTTLASVNPDPPTNIQATIQSSTSISVSWTAPVNTGDSTIRTYYIYYQKVGDSSWEVLDPDSDNTSATISGLLASTQYNIKVIARNSNNNDSIDSDTVIATTATPGFYLITDCQQFQDIQNDFEGNYELARNIDCSDTINWNSGAGFQPIGNLFMGTFFSGILAGNNYTISDLYINQDNQGYAFAAPFGATSGALIQDVRIVRPVVSATNSEVSSASGLIAYDNNPSSLSTSVNNVHITDASISGNAEVFVYASGLISASLVSETASDNQNEFRGTINVEGSTAGAFIVGGLYGALEGGTRNVNNSYANANITTNNTYSGESMFAITGGLLGGNGLIEGRPTQTTFNHSYAAGSITHDSAQPTNSLALGGIVGAVVSELSIENSFARNSLTSLQPGVVGGSGGILAGGYGSDVRTYSNNYFDADEAGTTDCIDPGYGAMTNCTPISDQPNYFYNNTTNGPLSTWDFDNIWKTTSTLPVFGQKVLTSITAIPESRLNPDPATPPASGTPTTTELSKKLKAPAVLTQFAAQGAPISAPKEEAGILGAIKRFFKNLPESVLVSFPYVLFSLLLLAAAAMLIQVVIGSRRLAATKLLIAKQKAVAEERDTFWHLAANYLRAPITLMIGGVELLSTDKDIRVPAVAQLEVFAKNLQKKVFAIMARIEQSRTLQDIHWPELETGSRVLTQLKFWLPVGLVAFFAVSMNLVAKNYRNLSLSSTNLAIQLLIFLLVSVLFYWVLSALGLVNRKRKQAETLLEQQSATLDDARTDFIEQSATTLNKDLTDFEAQLDSIPKKAASVGIIHEGAHRLRTLIDSFELLVAAQNNKLDNLSPAAAHTQLNTIFSSVLSSLQPIISQKQLNIVTPNFNNITLPGNALLLNQVIGSVVSNAVAFSPTGSTIQLDLKQHKDGTRLSVTNQGKTIDENQLSHVFSPLTKADGYDALQLDHGGLGVNLYIDKLIMQHLGGGISVASDAHKGTTLTMLWPKNIS